MAVDDAGNARIDFVWGNFPLQPNHNDNAGDNARWGMSPYPGDAEAEYFLSNRNPGISNQLQAIDSHVIALRHWQNYPDFTPNDGYDLTVDWWDITPAYQYPNIPGVSKEEAIKQLIECGVDPAILVDVEFDAPDEYKYIGYDGDNYYDPINAPGADNPAVIFYKYFEPNDVIGQHSDGRDWLAKESEGMVLTADAYPGDWVPVGNYQANYFPGWHSFVVVNTTDPTKDSWQWWN